MPNETISPEVECLKLKAALNENHRLAQKAAGDAIERAILAGELLAKWKSLLTHGKFEAFVESHFEGSVRTARMYMQAAKGLKALPKRQSFAVLNSEDTMQGLLSRLKKDDSGEKKISDKGKPGGAATSLGNSPASSGPASEEAADSEEFEIVPIVPANYIPPRKTGEDERTDSTGQEAPQERDPRPPRSGKEQNYGKCPNCAGVKWDVETEGVSCSKCHHPHGEPKGDPAEDEDPAAILRSKGVKTMEAAMRVFDDLNLLVPKAGAHKQCIELCKSLLKSAKGWK